MLYSGPWTMRLIHMHKYLCDNLKSYSTNCCAVFPPDKLCPPLSRTSATELNLVFKTYESNLTDFKEHEGGAPLQFQIDSQLTHGKERLKPKEVCAVGLIYDTPY